MGGKTRRPTLKVVRAPEDMFGCWARMWVYVEHHWTHVPCSRMARSGKHTCATHDAWERTVKETLDAVS